MYVLLLIVVLFWGGNFVVLKFGLTQLSPEGFTALRFLASSPLLLFLALYSGIDLKIKSADIVRVLVLGIVYTAFYQTLFAAAVNYTTVGNSSLIMATSPLFTAVMSYMLGYEKFTQKAIVGSLLSFFGVFIVVRSAYAVGLTMSTLKGDMLTLAASVVWASYAIYIRGLMERYHFLSLLFYSSAIGGVVLTVYSWSNIREVIGSGMTPTTIWALVYSVLGVTVYGLSIWYYGIGRLGPTKTYVFMNLNPIIAGIAGTLVLGEVLTAAKVIGLLITLLGINIARKHIKKTPERTLSPRLESLKT